MLKGPFLLCQQDLTKQKLPPCFNLGKRTAQKEVICCFFPRILSSLGSSHIHDYTHSGLKWVVAVPMTDTMAAKTSSCNSTFFRTECSFSAKSKHTQSQAMTVAQTIRSCHHHDWALTLVTRGAVFKLSSSSAVALRSSKAPEVGVCNAGHRELPRTLCSPFDWATVENKAS